MARVRACVLVMLCCMVLGGPCGPALGMEVNVQLSNTFSYLYSSQMGRNGFFGPFNVDRSQGGLPDQFAGPFLPLVPAGGDAAVTNGWLGTSFGIVSGSDASLCSVSTSFFVDFRANPAISLTGVYRAGNSEAGAFPGATVGFANGEWLQLYTKLETPWGAVSYGKRPFGFGLGFQYDESNRTEDYLALVADYGPFQFGLGVYPARPGADLMQGRDMLGNPVVWYLNTADKNGRPVIDLFGFMNYWGGPLEMGVGFITASQRLGPEGGTFVYQAAGPAAALFGPSRGDQPAMDVSANEGWAYLKYNNGRFFLNVEADWYYRKVKFQRSLSGRFALPVNVTDGTWWTQVMENVDGSGSIFRPQHTESWRYMAELGSVTGPAKISFLYAFVPGPDRRHGVLIDRQPVIVNPLLPNVDQVLWNPDLGNAKVFRAYTSLFGSQYASGVGAISRGGSTVFLSGEGYIVDASVLAARFDYAVASNLNIWASFFKAKRVSHGYGWGYIKPMVQSAIQGYIVRYGFPAPPLGLPPPYRVFTLGLPGPPSPAIPDDDLGYEVTAGLDWGLLEGLNLNVSFAYWQPGRWFNFACIDKSVEFWDNPTQANFWGANPNRSIDAIMGLTVTASVSF